MEQGKIHVFRSFPIQPAGQCRHAAFPGLAACYGTLGLVSVLGTLGIAIAVDQSLWAGAIVGFAALAVIGLGLGLARHRQPWPILIGGLGAAIIAYVMYVQYDRLIEISGFVLLVLAAVADWRLKSAR